MGTERAVTRWYAQRQLLSEEIVRLQVKLAQPLDTNKEVQEVVDLQSLQEELTKAQEKQRLLGPCPQPMMS